MTLRAGSGERATVVRWRVSSLWHLVYLDNLFFQPVFDDRWWQWPLAVGVVVVFVPLYVLAERGHGPLRRWSPILATALGVLVTPLNAGASVLFVYAAAAAGTSLTRRVSTRWLAGLTLLTAVLMALSSVPFPSRIYLFAPPLLFVWVIGLVCMDEADREEESATLRVDNARIEHLATLSERERISRDLHDLLGQSLTGVVVRSQLAQRLARSDPDRGVAEMAEVERAARAALSEVRATVQGWRQVVLDDELAVARDALTAADVELTVSRDPDLVLTPSAETALSLALREAVTNVVRHAHARRCTVALRHDGGRVVLEVADDGVGGVAAEGSGLTGMRERIAALGGDVQHLVRNGTAITVALPAIVAT